MSYQEKYLKYKEKYLTLKNMIGGETIYLKCPKCNKPGNECKCPYKCPIHLDMGCPHDCILKPTGNNYYDWTKLRTLQEFGLRKKWLKSSLTPEEWKTFVEKLIQLGIKNVPIEEPPSAAKP